MRGVRDGAARNAFKPAALLEKIIPAVIANLVEKSSVRVADLGDVRSIQNNLSTFEHGGLHLVHSFGTGPDVVIHSRQHGKHASKGAIQPLNVLLGRELDCRSPRLARRTEMQAGDARATGIVLPRENQRKARNGHAYFGGSSIDQFTNRRDDGADEVIAAEQSSQPVRLVNHFPAADARKQILVSAGKPNYFVGKHRPTNQYLVVVEEQTIDFDQDWFGKQAAGACRHFVRGDRTQIHKCAGEIPAMIEDACLAALSVDHGLAHQTSQCRITHKRVRAKRDQVVACGGPGADLFLQKPEHQRHRHGARAIGNDGEHALAGYMKLNCCLRHDLANFIVSQRAGDDTLAKDHCHSCVLTPRGY